MTKEKDNYTFFYAYVIAYSSEPGGTVNIRARQINKKFDLYEPKKGRDVLLPAGVVFNFEEIGDSVRDNKDAIRVGVLNAFVERHGTLADAYDVDNRPPSKFENRNDEWFPEDALDL